VAMYVSIIGNHPKCGANAIITAKLGEDLPVGFEAQRVLSAAPSLIESLMQAMAAAADVSPHRETIEALRAQAGEPAAIGDFFCGGGATT